MACEIQKEDLEDKTSVNKINFNYKFIEGVAEQSFGIYVAKAAGLNDKVLEIALRKSNQFNDRLAQLVM